MLRPITVALPLAFVSAAAAQPFFVPIDQNASSVTVELTVPLAGSDSDTSAVSGFFEIDLDSIDTPAQLTLYDFQVNLVSGINLHVGNFIVGTLDVNANNVSIADANPGVAKGPSPIVNDAFALPGVLASATGTLDYTATGGICTILTANSVPCNSMINLADQGPLASGLAGTITTANRLVTYTASIDVTVPLNPDPNGADLGSVRVFGTVTGSVTVPVRCPADLTGSTDPNNPAFGVPDGVVDANDFFFYLSLFGAGDLAADLTGSADPNSPDFGVPDGSLDGSDFFFYLNLFAQGCN